MIRLRSLHRLVVVAALFAAAFAPAGPSAAQTIVDQWNSVTVPTAPPLKPAALDAKTTALLVFDILQQNCTPRPRCMATVPHIAALLATARAKGVYVVFAKYAPTAEILAPVAPGPGDPIIVGTADRFLNTDLDAMLKAKGIKTVIVTGSASNGVLVYTASEAAMRGYNVVVPLDGTSSDSAYTDQYVTIQLVTAPTVSNKVTLTRTDLISF